MNIDRHNYEAYILDYLDGKLDVLQIIALQEFLDRNPDLRKEVDELRNIRLQPEAASFRGKEDLKKTLADTGSPGEKNFDEWAVAFVEDDLEEAQREAFLTFVHRHPEREKDLAYYRKVFLKPDHSVIYGRKCTLKKGLVNYRWRVTLPYVLAAASAALILVFYLALNPSGRWSHDNTLLTGTGGSVAGKEQIPDAISQGMSRATTVEKESGNELPPHVTTSPREAGLEPPSGNGAMASAEATAVRVVMEYRASRDAILPVLLSEYGVIHRQKKAVNSSRRSNEVLTVRQFAIQQFKKEVLLEDPRKIDPDRITVWDLAEAGVIGVNRITGWNMSLTTEYDEEGDLSNLAFSSKVVSFTHSPKN